MKAHENLIEFLQETNADENTVIFALNCFRLGVESERRRLAAEIEKLPFGDTAASFAAFVRNGGKA